MIGRIARIALLVFAPGHLARRDTRKIYEVLNGAPRRCIDGLTLAVLANVPDYQFKILIKTLEEDGYVERDPGPWDVAWTRDVFASRWCPGRRW